MNIANHSEQHGNTRIRVRLYTPADHDFVFCGVPTLTLFGPQLPEWFAPLHPASEWIEGKVCPYMPCSDYCRYPVPNCLRNIREEEVWVRVEAFVEKHLRGSQPKIA